MTRTFLVTGTSSGFGAELVKRVILQGDNIVAASRDSAKLVRPETATDSNYLAVDLDVCDKQSINSAFARAIEKFGRIDVVINNAGYAVAGEFESTSDTQVRSLFDVNCFGVFNVTRKALATMRTQSPPGGVIQQVTSIGGQVSAPLFSIYVSSKWAVEGFTEAVAGELKPEWNIHLTCVEPGAFNTEFTGTSLLVADQKVAAYDHVDATKLSEMYHGKLPGDSTKAAKCMYELAVMEKPPLRCALGPDAYDGVKRKLESYQDNLQKYEKSFSQTDRDDLHPPAP
ncbi:hypothetical protein PYCC9005_002497 [Savitreella phatthalungensis]